MFTNEKRNAVIIKNGKFDLDGQQFNKAENLVLTGIEVKGTDNGNMYILETAERETGEEFRIYLNEPLFVDFGARYITYLNSTENAQPPFDLKVYQPEEKRFLCLLYPKGSSELIKTFKGEEMPKWNVKEGKLLDRNAQIDYIIEQISPLPIA